MVDIGKYNLILGRYFFKDNNVLINYKYKCFM